MHELESYTPPVVVERERHSLVRQVRRGWRSLSARAFPPEAVTFQLRVWARGRATPAERSAAANLVHNFGLSHLWVIHGNALTTPAGATVVSGPAGIGKSTVSRRLEELGDTHLLEDGIVVVGVSGSRWYVVETGTLEVLRLTSRISKRIRTLLLLDRSVFWQADGHRRTATLWLFRHLTGHPSYRLALLLARRPETFAPRLHPLHKIVICRHPSSPCSWYRFDGDGTCTESAAPPPLDGTSVELAVHSSLGTREEVHERLLRALAG